MNGEPYIEIKVPLATPLKRIIEMAMEQAWEKAGTQLRAAIALGITPETISRTLSKKRKLARSDNAQKPDTAPGSDASPPPGGKIEIRG